MAHRPNGRNNRPQPLDWQQRTKGTAASREDYRQRRQDLAGLVAARLDKGRELDDLAAEIRLLMAELAKCTTPAGRAAIEAKVRPLAETRRWLLGGLPVAS